MWIKFKCLFGLHRWDWNYYQNNTMTFWFGYRCRHCGIWRNKTNKREWR